MTTVFLVLLFVAIFTGLVIYGERLPKIPEPKSKYEKEQEVQQRRKNMRIIKDGRDRDGSTENIRFYQ